MFIKVCSLKFIFSTFSATQPTSFHKLTGSVLLISAMTHWRIFPNTMSWLSVYLNDCTGKAGHCSSKVAPSKKEDNRNKKKKTEIELHNHSDRLRSQWVRWCYSYLWDPYLLTNCECSEGWCLCIYQNIFFIWMLIFHWSWQYTHRAWAQRVRVSKAEYKNSIESNSNDSVIIDATLGKVCHMGYPQLRHGETFLRVDIHWAEPCATHSRHGSGMTSFTGSFHA